MKKINIIADKNRKSLFLKKIIKKINLSNITKQNLNIVIGGDGFMLKTLKLWFIIIFLPLLNILPKVSCTTIALSPRNS